MLKQNSMKLGELYRELRIARGLKLKDVASGNLSISQLSRFENGQTMLAADKLLLAIAGIHMSFAEFGLAVNNYEESDFFKRGKKVFEYYTKQDIVNLKKTLEDYDDYETFDTYNRLNRLMIQVAIHSLDSDYLISHNDIEFLTTYLYGIEEWTEYELYIFGNTLTILSDDDLVFLGKAFIERDKLYISIPNHKKSAEMTLLNLILILIERKKIDYASYFMDCLEKLLTYQDMFATVFLNFFKHVVTYLQGGLADITILERYINMVEELGNPIAAEFFRMNLQRILS